MQYPEFNDIKIKDQIGVSPVSKDTLKFAHYAGKLKFKRALEIGTGTGFVPIYLHAIGKQCDGTDINRKAIDCAIENAKLNHANINLYVSDLFKDVQEKFELILFNPPHGNVRSTFFSKHIELIKSLLPKESILLLKLSYPLIKKERRQLIKLFLEQASTALDDSGKIFMSLYKNEFDLIFGMSYEILGEQDFIRFVLLAL